MRTMAGLGLGVGLMLVLASCSRVERDVSGDRLRVVATLFPLYDWAREVGGDNVEVHFLLPPGVDVHAFSPRPSHLRKLRSADVLLFLGADLEPWFPALARDLPPDILRIEVGRSIPRMHGHDGTGCSGCETHRDTPGHAHGPHDSDPHIWLDPLLARDMVAEIGEALARADPSHADGYRRRAADYQEALKTLHERIAANLARCPHRTLIMGGHFAFGYFARRYGLEHVSPYPGFAADALPSPGNMARLVEVLRASGQNVLFHEALLEPTLARALAGETGARLVPLHTLHNLSRDDWQSGRVTYLSLMEWNLRQILEAWGCE